VNEAVKQKMEYCFDFFCDLLVKGQFQFGSFFGAKASQKATEAYISKVQLVIPTLSSKAKLY